MKRTSFAIIFDLITSINTLIQNEEYPIELLSKFSSSDIETTKMYIKIIEFIQQTAPPVNIQNGKIKILSKYNNYINLDDDEQILVFSLENNATNQKLAIYIPESMQNGLKFLIEKNYGELTNQNKFFLSKRGKAMALDIFLDIQKKMDRIDEKIQMEIKNEHEKTP